MMRSALCIEGSHKMGATKTRRQARTREVSGTLLLCDRLVLRATVLKLQRLTWWTGGRRLNSVKAKFVNESASAQRSLCTPLRLPLPSQTCWQMSSEDDNEVTLMSSETAVHVTITVVEQFFEQFFDSKNLSTLQNGHF